MRFNPKTGEWIEPGDHLCHGSSGGGGGSNISDTVYTPQNQPQADTNWWSNISNLQNQVNQGLSPGQAAYPAVVNTAAAVQQNPYASEALQGAQNASDWAYNLAAPTDVAGTNNLMGLGALGSVYGGAVGNTAVNPVFGTIQNALQNNPFLGQAMAGAAGANTIGSNAANAASLSGLQLGGTPLATANMGNNFAQPIGNEEQAANSILQQGFDPQNALYNQTLQKLTDQTNAQLANSGVAATPYGQGVLGDTLGNFNIDWQNNQLNRMSTAGSAATGLNAGAAGLANTAAGLYGQAGTQASNLLGLGSGATSLEQSSFAAPYNQYSQYLNSLTQPAMQAASTAQAGTGALSNLISGSGNAYTGASNLSNNLINTLQASSVNPYNTYNTMQGNNMSALSNLINLGNAQYTLPEQLMNNLQSYMDLGQTASVNANQVGATNFSQLASGLGGASNLLFGSQGLGGSSGLLGGSGSGLLSNLFGGGAAGGAGALGAAAAGTLGVNSVADAGLTTAGLDSLAGLGFF